MYRIGVKSQIIRMYSVYFHITVHEEIDEYEIFENIFATSPKSYINQTTLKTHEGKSYHNAPHEPSIY